MYHKPTRYTSEELKEAKLDDLRTDIRCAVRHGLTEYAEECRKKYRKLLDSGPGSAGG
jgi:hypothetical protein